MPELPDVEVYKRYLDSTALHRKVSHVQVGNERILESVSPDTLERALAGKSIKESRRHGKYLFVHLDDQWLYMHFGMTGYLEFHEKEDGRVEHERVGFDFEDGSHLGYSCQRMFGKVGVTGELDRFIDEKHMGPDALSVDRETFLREFGQKTGMIKPALMDQKTVAGIGNIYSDEILYRSGIHPKTRVEDLSEADLKELYGNMQHVLKKAIDWEADPKKFPRSYLLPHRHPNGNCPEGGHKLKTMKVSGRTAYFCPLCQKK